MQPEGVDPKLREHWTLTGVTFDASALDDAPHPPSAVARTLVATHAPLDGAPGKGISMGDVIGVGGQAVVRTATQNDLKRTVAVKAVHHPTDEVISALLREAWVAGSLEHPNILPIHALASDEQGAPLLVMKRIEGVAWSDALTDPACIPGGATDVLEWHLRALLQLCRAIEFAHARGIVHLDIKPANVMLGEHGEVYLLDWGLAVTVDPFAPEWMPKVESIKKVLGTPGYISPEQAGGDGARIGLHTDVFLLGAVLYEIVNGRRLQPNEPIVAVTQAWRGLIPDFEPGVPGELEAICTEALSRDPDLRHPSVTAFRQAIEAFLQHRHANALADAALERLPAVISDPYADPRALHEVRFGLQQALAEWPGHMPAAIGLRELLVAVAELHLERGETDAAAAVLSELDDPEDAIATRIEVLRAAQEREAAEVEALRRDRDLDLNRQSRTVWVAAVGVFWLACNVVCGLLHRSGTFVFDHSALLILASVTLALFGVGAWYVRDSLRRVGVDRRMIDTIGAGLATVPFLWIAGAAMRLPVLETVSISTVLYLFFLMTQAINGERRIWWAVPILAPLVIAAAAWPTYAFEWAGLAGLLCAWVPAAIWGWAKG